LHTIETRAGRLLELRLHMPFPEEELTRFGEALRAAFAQRTDRLVLCTDIRAVTVFPPVVADRLVAMMKTDNPRIERSAFLLSGSAVFGLQVERMIREAGNPARRTFRDAPALTTWLGEVLTTAERARLETFLAAK
jgi:hypothetical protein